jgi:hypothetical protein
MGWLIRNGKTINFWHDNWLELGPLRGLLHNPLLPHEFNLKLGDVWDTHGNWDLGNLSFQFPPGISNHISASPSLQFQIWMIVCSGSLQIMVNSTRHQLIGWLASWRDQNSPLVAGTGYGKLIPYRGWCFLFGYLAMVDFLQRAYCLNTIISDDLCPICNT